MVGSLLSSSRGSVQKCRAESDKRAPGKIEQSISPVVSFWNVQLWVMHVHIITGPSMLPLCTQLRSCSGRCRWAPGAPAAARAAPRVQNFFVARL